MAACSYNPVSQKCNGGWLLARERWLTVIQTIVYCHLYCDLKVRITRTVHNEEDEVTAHPPSPKNTVDLLEVQFLIKKKKNYFVNQDYHSVVTGTCCSLATCIWDSASMSRGSQSFINPHPGDPMPLTSKSTPFPCAYTRMDTHPKNKEKQ